VAPTTPLLHSRPQTCCRPAQASSSSRQTSPYPSSSNGLPVSTRLKRTNNLTGSNNQIIDTWGVTRTYDDPYLFRAELHCSLHRIQSDPLNQKRFSPALLLFREQNADSLRLPELFQTDSLVQILRATSSPFLEVMTQTTNKVSDL
jgi:hypothetical protein